MKKGENLKDIDVLYYSVCKLIESMRSSMSNVLMRELITACGILCFRCCGVHTCSRHRVKRYKKLLADVFPDSQNEGPNDRKLAKLIEYVSRNPLRMPKINEYLEQRCYKELRNENFQHAKIVTCIYRRLLVSSEELMPMFANSLHSIIHILLDQSRQGEMQTIGCQTFLVFVLHQKDGTNMCNFEGFIPKLLRLANVVGEDDRAASLRSAGLQGLSSMIWFMGEHRYISAAFDNIVYVVLQNYYHPKEISESPDGNRNRWVQEVLKNEGVRLPSPKAIPRVPSWNKIVNDKGELNVTLEDCQNPQFWSRVCLHNMAKLANEAPTARRVLESLFRHFDDGDLWSLQHGLAFPVLKDIHILKDKSGRKSLAFDCTTITLLLSLIWARSISPQIHLKVLKSFLRPTMLHSFLLAPRKHLFEQKTFMLLKRR